MERVKTQRTSPELERYRHEADAEDAPDELSVEAADEALRAVLGLWGGRSG